MDDVMETYQRALKARTEANQVNKAAVFDALVAAAITKVIVHFDGEGDSGQIDSMTAYSGKTELSIPDAEVEILDVSWQTAKLDADRVSLSAAIESLCYDFLEQEHGGWGNNDGAFGEFTLAVEDRAVELEFNARFSDFTTYSHSF